MRIRFDRSISLQTVAIAALLAFAPVGMAHAQNSDTAGRLQRMEKEIQTLSRAVFKGEVPPVDAGIASDTTQANFQIRLDQMENDLRSLTGRIEEQSYELGRLRELETRIAALEARGAAAPAATTYPGGMGSINAVSPYGSDVSQSAGQPRAGAAQDAGFVMNSPGQPETGRTIMGNPDDPAAANSPSAGQLGSMGASGSQDASTVAYEAAYSMLRNQDYAGAESAFDAFIKTNPGHPLISNALYWLGETYYVRNDFEKAARVFAETYQKYPEGSKAPDSLLKLGMSLAGQGKGQDACIALAQLKKQYPVGASPVLTRADQEIARLGCK